MKIITVRRVDLQFDADQITHGSQEQQVRQAIDQINLVLQHEPFGLGAQLIVHRDEIEIEIQNLNRRSIRAGRWGVLRVWPHQNGE